MAEPASGSTNLSPAEKAAVLMMALGEADAAEVIKFLSPREVNRLSGAIARLNKVPKAMVENVMVEFVARIRDETAIGLGVTEYLRNALGKALGEERASALLERIMNGGDSAGIEAVKWEDPRGASADHCDDPGLCRTGAGAGRHAGTARRRHRAGDSAPRDARSHSAERRARAQRGARGPTRRRIATSPAVERRRHQGGGGNPQPLRSEPRAVRARPHQV